MIGEIISGISATIQLYSTYLQQRQVRSDEPSPPRIPDAPPSPGALEETVTTDFLDRSIYNLPFAETLRRLLLVVLPAQVQRSTVAAGSVEGVVKELRQGEPFSKRLIDAETLQSMLGEFLDYSVRLGLSAKQIERDERLRSAPIQVALSPIQLGACAIFYYLRDVMKYHLHLDCSFPHTLAISHALATRSDFRPDACLFAEAASLNVLNRITKPRFGFVMPLPPSDHRVVVPSRYLRSDQELELGTGIYTFMTEEVTTNLFHYENMVSAGKIDPRAVRIENLEPQEAITVLREGDPDRRLILWSPHWQILERMGLGKVLPESEYWYHNLLFLRRGFYKEKRKQAESLVSAICDAWIRLHDYSAVMKTVDAMVADADYVENMRRICGLYQVDSSGHGRAS